MCSALQNKLQWALSLRALELNPISNTNNLTLFFLVGSEQNKEFFRFEPDDFGAYWQNCIPEPPCLFLDN